MNHDVSSGSLAAKSPQSETEISAALNFARRQDTKPEFHSSGLTGGAQKIFFDTESHTATISDMREVAENLSIHWKSLRRQNLRSIRLRRLWESAS